MPNETYSYTVQSSETRGLDPARYVVKVLVHRADEEPLTDADCKRIEAALAPERVKAKPAKQAPAARTKRAAPASKAKAARTAQR